jgi:pimeloyl-ACP methyl ester carboxylesterase
VFIHGLLATPAGWSLMIDQLTADPSLRERFQFLTLSYNSLQPIPESGRELVEALSEARRRFDPDGSDDSFDRVVLVGHSLGGLVAEAAATRAPRPRPFGAGPQPCKFPKVQVGRVIFVATPHRGSPLDRGVVRSVGASLARAVSPSIAARHVRDGASALCSPTSVDQLACDHPSLQDLERAGIAAGVPYHSIIAALGVPTDEGATDGLVPVASARLKGARSEVVVRASHICLQHPEVIREVRRVLGEHAAEATRLPGPGPGGSLSAESVGALSVPPVSPEARLVALQRPAALLKRETMADAFRLIRPRVSPESSTP